MDYSDILKAMGGQVIEDDSLFSSGNSISVIISTIDHRFKQLKEDDIHDKKQKATLTAPIECIKHSIESDDNDDYTRRFQLEECKRIYKELVALEKRYACREKYRAIWEVTKTTDLVYGIDGSPYEKLLKSISDNYRTRNKQLIVNNLLICLKKEESLVRRGVIDETDSLDAINNLGTPWGGKYPPYILLGYYGRWLWDKIPDNQLIVHTITQLLAWFFESGFMEDTTQLFGVTSFPQLLTWATPRLFSLVDINNPQVFSDMDADDFCYTLTGLIKEKLRDFNMTKTTFRKLKMIDGNNYKGIPILQAICIQTLKDVIIAGGGSVERV